MMRSGRTLGLAGAVAVAAGLAWGMESRPASAQGVEFANMSCDQLWYERNSIYAQYGYCFKTDRAVRTFGRGCSAPYGRLPPRALATVENITSWERRKGCN